jgi:hypothetical protein
MQITNSASFFLCLLAAAGKAYGMHTHYSDPRFNHKFLAMVAEMNNLHKKYGPTYFTVAPETFLYKPHENNISTTVPEKTPPARPIVVPKKR